LSSSGRVKIVGSKVSYLLDDKGNETPDPEELEAQDPGNHFMRLGNPYMIAVKHYIAAQKAKENKQPV
jgi:hypothetical protein